MNMQEFKRQWFKRGEERRKREEAKAAAKHDKYVSMLKWLFFDLERAPRTFEDFV